MTVPCDTTLQQWKKETFLVLHFYIITSHVHLYGWADAVHGDYPVPAWCPDDLSLKWTWQMPWQDIHDLAWTRYHAANVYLLQESTTDGISQHCSSTSVPVCLVILWPTPNLPWLLRVQCGKKDQRITKNDFAPRLPWRPPHSKAVTNTDQGVKHACRHFIFRLEKLWQLLKELLHGIPSFKKLTTFAPSFIQARWFFLHILSFHLYNEISRFFGTTINWTKPVNLHFYLQKLDRFHDVWFTRTRYQARVVDK